MRKVISFTVLFLLLAWGFCFGRVLPLDLNHMVREANVIVVGKITKTVEFDNNEPGVATIEIERLVRGSYDQPTIEIYYHPQLTITGRPLFGDRCVYFVNTGGTNNTIVQGYAGMVPVKDGKVRVLFIRGEQEYQNLEEFIAKIVGK